MAETDLYYEILFLGGTSLESNTKSRSPTQNTDFHGACVQQHHFYPVSIQERTLLVNQGQSQGYSCIHWSLLPKLLRLCQPQPLDKIFPLLPQLYLQIIKQVSFSPLENLNASLSHHCPCSYQQDFVSRVSSLRGCPCSPQPWLQFQLSLLFLPLLSKHTMLCIM